MDEEVKFLDYTRLGHYHTKNTRELAGVDMKIDNSNLRNYAILSTGKYGTNTTYKHRIFPVIVGEKYVIKAVGSSGARCGFFSSTASPTSGGDLPLVSGTSLIELESGEEISITIPTGTVALAVHYGSSPYSAYKPNLFKILPLSSYYDKIQEGDRMLNIGDEWESVALEFGRLCHSGKTFPDESTTTHCITKPIHAKKGDYYKGYWECPTPASYASAVLKTDADNSVGVSPLLEVASGGEQWVEFKIEEDCYFGLQIASATIGNAVLYVKHAAPTEIEGNAVSSDAFPFENEVGYHRVLHWKNGTYGNKANANYVHCESYDIPDGVGQIMFKTSRPVASGCQYQIALNFLNSAGNSIGAISASTATEISIPQNVPSGAKRAYLALRQYNTSSSSAEPLRYSDMAGYESWICPFAAGYLAKVLEDAKTNDPTGVVDLNKERLIALSAICRRNKINGSPYKDIELLVCTDEHADNVSGERAIDATNGFNMIDAYVNCGDICEAYFRKSNIDAFQERFGKLSKPGYVVVGNHDVGNAYYVGVCGNHAQVYEAFIKPMVDAGYLANGEYTPNIPYWYHDNTTYKVRLIGLYEFDDNLDLADSLYWEPVTYDSSAPNLAYSTAYAVGDVVNCGSAGWYTAHSFRCKSAVTTPANYYSDIEKLPRFQVLRGSRLIRQTQAQWFLDTLASTPANYGVIVLMHQPISNSAGVIEGKFSQPNTPAISITTSMATDFIAEALQAFVDGTSYSPKVVMSGLASYMNTQSSGGVSYAYEVSKDFSQKNTGVHLLGSIAGHRHKDVVYKLGNIYQVDAICATTVIPSTVNSDIRRARGTTIDIARDCLTVVSMSQGRIGLAKLGVNVTENGTPRDYQVIDTTVESS